MHGLRGLRGLRGLDGENISSGSGIGAPEVAVAVATQLSAMCWEQSCESFGIIVAGSNRRRHLGRFIRRMHRSHKSFCRISMQSAIAWSSRSLSIWRETSLNGIVR